MANGVEWGIGPSHVVTRTNHITLLRWGFWSPYFAFFFSKILPVEQVMHDHEGNFIAFLLWGRYTEYVRVPGQKELEVNKYRWVNIVKWDTLHLIKCDKPVYTIQFMGKKMHEVVVEYKGRLIPFKRLCKRDGRYRSKK
jgi:hypothetical protein